MAAFVAFILLLMTGTLVPVNSDFRQTPDGIQVFVVSNGVHSDLVFPVREPRTATNWLQKLNDSTVVSKFGRYEYIGFGWGNEGFYLGSYGRQFPGLGATLRAAFPSPTLLHVDFYKNAPQPSERVVPLLISEAQYRQLTAFVVQSWQTDSAGRPLLMNAAGYTPDDFFVRAKDKYHLLRTCNDWTNRGLRTSGLRAALKAPFAASVLYQARQASKKPPRQLPTD
ncbi:DUF2459 domain-containing protein [Hymenobacter qilianensis]|uniref:DUF2459 domain-containing protein n=2 Tax=Hymenobacter qilianensis TaxID=1385715 RepID=A0A7H0GUW6_9BACT|nr:DUF2459 domain-containing protein [Hymenobacter qilianensis]QNP52082.1 DUF2459 domain-containing protein [Hymenobacter qilianensis]